MPQLKMEMYTIDDIYTLPEGKRAELIDGVIYDMAPPNRIHQKPGLLIHKGRRHRPTPLKGRRISGSFSFDDRIEVGIYQDFMIKIAGLLVEDTVDDGK